MTTKDQTPAEALADLKRALADTSAWRMLVGFVDRHPLVALYSLPALLIVIGVVYAAQGRYLESGFMAAVVAYLGLRNMRIGR